MVGQELSDCSRKPEMVSMSCVDCGTQLEVEKSYADALIERNDEVFVFCSPCWENL